MSNPRRATVEVRYAGRNITRQIRNTLINFVYTEKTHGEADELNISLNDRSGRWRNRWYPMRARGRNARLRAWIICENWFRQGDRFRVYCGEFEVDSCDFTSSANGDIFTIKALSTPTSSRLRRERKSRAWEGVTLRKVANDIARQNRMQLFYRVGEEIILDRVDQIRRSDLEFLTRLARDYGVAVKVSNGRIILFEEASLERRAPVVDYQRAETSGNVLSRNFRPGNILNIKLSQSITEVVEETNVAYKNPRTGQVTSASFSPPGGASTGQRLQSNQRP